MNPEQQPTEDNSQSLEGASLEGGAGESLESSAPAGSSQNFQPSGTITPDTGGVVPAPGSSPASPEPPRNKHFFKRLWQKLNIYLLLFILIIIVVVGVTVALYLKNKSANNNAAKNNTIASQSLSSDALQQLAKNGVQIGDPTQTLNVQSNSVFSGAVLVRGELQVAGGLKIGGGTLSVTDLSVSGSGSIAKLQTKDLSVQGNGAIQGQLTVQQGLSVKGNGSFSGALTASQLTAGVLQLTGDLTITHHLVAGGSIPGRGNGNALGSGGTSSVSGSDTAGSINIHTGGSTHAGCFTNINFTQHFQSTPHVVVTPIGSAAAGINYYVQRSTTGFSVCTTNAAPGGSSFGFDYIALD